MPVLTRDEFRERLLADQEARKKEGYLEDKEYKGYLRESKIRMSRNASQVFSKMRKNNRRY
jgi:hypothetical protein